ncbi:MAG: hypothetical protein ACK41Q_08915 [Candidatus Brocadia sp.]
MDNYIHPENAIPLLEEAHELMKESFTVSMVLALAKAQLAFDSDWYKV